MTDLASDDDLIASIRTYYQPIITLVDMQPAYVEVLVRRARPDGTVSGPETIVDAMTGSVRSMQLTMSIIAHALAEYDEYDFIKADLTLAFNVPLDAMMHPDLVPTLEAVRAKTRVPARNIRFELTEQHPVEDVAAAQAVVLALHQAGYCLALDDISPDMPKISELLHLPTCGIKIDRSVVISSDKSDKEFIRRVVAEAHVNRQQDVIAEGIETPELLEEMRSLGVSHGQGYLFARPIPAEKLREMIR
jgi:EAL domain-containing protein (putative c-di-GMP-specific phosphodiesterase class I)